MKDAALGDRLFSTVLTNGSIGIPGRSIAWKVRPHLDYSQQLTKPSLKLFLLGHEPLETSPVRADALLETLRVFRGMYKELLLEKMKAPDGSYDMDLVMPGTTDVKVKDWMRKSHTNLVDGTSGIASMTMTSAGMHLRSDSSSNLELNNPLSLHNEVPLSLSHFIFVRIYFSRTPGLIGSLRLNYVRPYCRMLNARRYFFFIVQVSCWTQFS